MRLIHTQTAGLYAGKTFRDAEHDEYRVRFYKAGKHMVESDYHTDDKKDAINTCIFQTLQLNNSLSNALAVLNSLIKNGREFPSAVWSAANGTHGDAQFTQGE